VPGPLPEPNARRTNAPTIPTTNLPPGGRPGRAPALPPTAKLGKAGRAWWRWAWKTPQAAAWASGHEGVVARRASLEDDLASLEAVRGVDFEDFVGEKAPEVRQAVQRVAALATGRLQICKEMRELDDRLGLTPKAMAQLRWSIKGDDNDESAGRLAPVEAISDRWRSAATG
jgi:hypothetical protein